MSMRGDRGFLLLEALVALAIVGLVGVATLGTVGAELRTAADMRHILEADALAEVKLATLELLSSEQLRTIPDSVARGRFAPPFDAYRWRATARHIPNEDHLYDLAVRVEWDDGARLLETLAYRREQSNEP